MKKLVISTPFKKAVIGKAQTMVSEGSTELLFIDEHNKKFDGMFIFIDKKPQSVLFTLTFPEDFTEGAGKKIYVGSN